MKLFKSLLVAPAALGLLAPMSATANEINLNDVSGYTETSEVESISAFDAAKELAVTNSRVDGLEARFNDFEAGSFSETTTASFSADFAIGDEDTAFGRGVVNSLYGFQIDLNTSFTGEDSFDVSLDAGNGGNGLSELDLNEGGGGDDVLTVDGVAYTFPLYGGTVFVGDNMDGSTLFSTACVYGGPSNNLDDCGNGNSAIGGGSGTAAGASYSFDNGVSVAVGYTGAGSSTAGLATLESDDAYAGQVSYAADSFGVSATYGHVENFSGSNDRNFIGLNGYWTPSETGYVPSVSVGYETGEAESLPDTSQWFVGLQWDEAGPGTLGVAMGTVGASTDTDTHLKDGSADPELMMYEAFYSYAVNDGVTVTPLIYIKEIAPAFTGDDELLGVMVKTSFSF